jgi:putative hydrolase of the HAD superfamily
LQALASTTAVFFDVDFTLIHPGPRFQGRGYHETCTAHGVEVHPDRFEAAVRGASGGLESADQLYDPALFVNYTRRIIELMGGTGPAVLDAARELYDAWAEQHHFVLYDDVADSLQALAGSGLRLGLISNSHRCLESFRAHFDLRELISVTVSSLEHGFLKPHPSIFRAALARARVPAAEAAMVGDSLAHDVLGAESVGMHGILLARGSGPAPVDLPVDVIRSLAELPALLERV